MPIIGDYSKLEALASAFGDTKRHREQIAAALGKWIKNKIDEEFDEGKGPYGAWAPRKQTYTKLVGKNGRVAVRREDKRQNPLLENTGWFRNSFHVFTDDRGVDVLNFVPYAFYLQYGAPKHDMPARKTLPEVEYDSLGDWGEPLIEIALERLRQSLEKK